MQGRQKIMKDRFYILRYPGIILFGLFIFSQVLYPLPTEADPTIPGFYGSIHSELMPPAVNALPELNRVVQGAVVSTPINNCLDIHQTQKRAILEWDSFDIGEFATVNFDQQGNMSWLALNRILDASPSLIYGTLRSDGRIYLINQNGILFSPTSQVNVHSLVASSLEIDPQDFLQGVLRFYGQETNGTVSNHGVIETGKGGYCFLLGPNVENSGVILSPIGQVGLAAGTDIEIKYDMDNDRYFFNVNETSSQGTATNFENGWIIADTGIAGMYGRVVNQEGLVRSVEALEKDGMIELLASELVYTGPESVTECPISDSTETAHSSFTVDGGDIFIDGTLQKDVFSDHSSQVAVFEHHGEITAPSGQVYVNASDRVCLDSTSTIDVSGAWIDQEAGDDIIHAQLNSVELRDDYGQKDGILQGETIEFHSLWGSSIGEISGSLSDDEVTALEQATEGGQVSLISSGDIIIREDATIDISGGGIEHGIGTVGTTKLLSGHTVYDIGSAPEWITYDRILGSYEKSYDRYGITKEYKGIYYGGANPLHYLVAGYIQGSDAGELVIETPRLSYAGILDGSVITGYYQVESEELEDEYGYQIADGWEVPRGGTLRIGVACNLDNEEDWAIADQVTKEIVVTSKTADLPDDFGSNPEEYPYPEEWNDISYIPSYLINDGTLGSVQLYANTGITTEEGADIVLASDGELILQARAIEHYGDISVPSGKISFRAQENMTSRDPSSPIYIGMTEGIYLAGGSSIVTAGETIDNSISGGNAYTLVNTDHLDGGDITIMDTTQGSNQVILAEGSVIDVSGGYEITSDADVNAGDAGSLAIQGSTIVLEGYLMGYSVIGAGGGSISLHATEVAVVDDGVPCLPDGFSADDGIPDAMKDKLIIAQDRFEDTGFTELELISFGDLTLADGITLQPSYVKIKTPIPEGGAVDELEDFRVSSSRVSGLSGRNDLVYVKEEYLGDSSISLRAGEALVDVLDEALVPTLAEIITLPSRTEIRLAPGGSIEIEAPNVTIAGQLEAPSGTIHVTATSDQNTESPGLILKGTAGISADGWLMPAGDQLANGLPVSCTPMSGGQVILESQVGDLVLEEGSLVDVSGSEPTLFYTENGSGVISTVQDASEPGMVSLVFYDDLVLDGEIRAFSNLESVHGGTLCVEKSVSYVDSDDLYLDLCPGFVLDLVECGFDDLTFRSNTPIVFADSMDISLARGITLDTPMICSAGTHGGAITGQQVALSAPSVLLTNTYYPTDAVPDPGDATMTLSGTWLDVEGDVAMSGFDDVTLESRYDMTLADSLYTAPSTGVSSVWSGALRTAADLTLTAARVYPTTMSDFTITSEGKVSISPSNIDMDASIYSAGGSLLIEARDIEHRGYLASPMGSISLHADNRVYLGPESVTTNTGDGLVEYGDMGEIYWTRQNKENLSGNDLEVENAPEKTITITGDTDVIVRNGARIDSSGGGTIFSYLFQPGIAGSSDPLLREGSYVVMEGRYEDGEAIYLEGSGYLSEGVYTILPVEYAFLPGAYVITDQGIKQKPWESLYSKEGFSLVTGYSCEAGTDYQSAVAHTYTIRTAEDVLCEGDYNYQEIAAGDAGMISVIAPTAILNGSITTRSLSGYEQGILAVSAARNEIMGASAMAEELVVNFDDLIPEELDQVCILSAEGLSDRGIGEIRIGDISMTDIVELKEDAYLSASKITLSARESIAINEGSMIEAAGQGGTLSIVSPEGIVEIGGNAELHASDTVSISASKLINKGIVSSDEGTLILAGNILHVTQDSSLLSSDTDGLILTQDLAGFSGFDSLSLKSGSDLIFSGDVSLSVAQNMSLDAARIACDHAGGNDTVVLSAETIGLLNLGGQAGEDSYDDTAAITFSADEITIGRGDIILDGFSSIAMEASGEVVFKGKGSLTIDSGASLAQDAAMSIVASRVATSFYLFEESNIQDYLEDILNGEVDESLIEESMSYYETADFTLNAGERTVIISSSGEAPEGTQVPGGSLNLVAAAIDHRGIIDVNSGQLTMEATGCADDGDGIFLREGSWIVSRGCDYASGGTVRLITGQGSLVGEEGAFIDVSAGSQGDAGSLSIHAPRADVVLDSTLLASGNGGAFSLETLSLEGIDFSALNSKLSHGEFTEEISVRIHTGNINLGEDETIRAHVVELTADAGTITIDGIIDASGEEGGRVDLYAYGDLSLSSSGLIDVSAHGVGEDGGEVTLGSSSAGVYFAQGSCIEVSGGPADYTADIPVSAGSGGAVHIRALREAFESDVELAGSINGASRVLAEAVAVYEDSSLDSADVGTTGTYYTQALAFMNSASSIEERLLDSLNLADSSEDAFHLIPGIEIVSEGNMTLSSDWDFKDWRFDGEAGILTLRAGGDLSIRNDLVDCPNSVSVVGSRTVYSPNNLQKDSAFDSWGINLMAGADLESADLLETVKGAGDLSINNAVVYTESGPVRFASGGDTKIERAPSAANYMINNSIQYNLATYDGSIRGEVAGDLILGSNRYEGIIQSATGDINLTVAGDLVMSTHSAIRTTGYCEWDYDYLLALVQIMYPSVDWSSVPDLENALKNYAPRFYTAYRDGGDISIRVQGDITGVMVEDYWDEVSAMGTWQAAYTSGHTAGIATMGGGDIRIDVGGSFTGQAGTFGQNEISGLEIYSNSDIDGRFLVYDGDLNLNAMGNVGSKDMLSAFDNDFKKFRDQTIEVFDTRVHVNALGGISIGTVLNPSVAGPEFAGDVLGYTEDTAVYLHAVGLDVTISGASGPYALQGMIQGLDYARILPGTLDLEAGRDIRFMSDLVLAPSSTGNLTLKAGRDIRGDYRNSSGKLVTADLYLCDLSPEEVYGDWGEQGIKVGDLKDYTEDLIHEDDSEPVTICAGGDIANLNLHLPKTARVTAGDDIRDIFVQGQNLNDEDVSMIKAEDDLLICTLDPAVRENTGIHYGGPGFLIVQAGGMIDLGSSCGIRSIANEQNLSLPGQGCSLAVIAGTTKELSPDQLNTLFEEIRIAGTEYSTLLADGPEAAADVVEAIREETIYPLFDDEGTDGGVSGEEDNDDGNIEMVRSQITTLGSDSDIFMIAGSKMEVGKSTFTSADTNAASDSTRNTGITTEYGGAINMLAMGDIDILESRAMTKYGGDITVWSDTGDINAGRGSKTAINAGKPKRVPIYEDGKIVGYNLVPVPVAVGSGMRTFTYDPDGITGPGEAPPAGDAYLFAPAGVIDAGEAGIAAENLIIGAKEVRNAQNIDVGGVTIGVPLMAESTGSLAALSGTSSLTEAAKLSEEVAGLGSQKSEEENKGLAEAFIPKWVKVMVIGFGDDEEEDKEKEK